MGQEIDRLETEGILEKVNCSEWAARVVLVPQRDGKFWLCSDYKVTVNPALEVDKHPLPHSEELMVTLTGGQHLNQTGSDCNLPTDDP